MCRFCAQGDQGKIQKKLYDGTGRHIIFFTSSWGKSMTGALVKINNRIARKVMMSYTKECTQMKVARWKEIWKKAKTWPWWWPFVHVDGRKASVDQCSHSKTNWRIFWCPTHGPMWLSTDHIGVDDLQHCEVVHFRRKENTEKTRRHHQFNFDNKY